MNYDLHANYPKLVENETADKLEQPKATQDFVWTDEYDDQPVNLTTLMRSMMNANNWEMANVFVNSWFRMACHGNPTAIHELLDRIEGPISKRSGGIRVNVPPDLMRKIEKLEEKKRLVSGVREAVTEIEEVLNEEPEPTEEKRLLTGAGEGSERGGRGGTIPPKEHRFKPGQSGNPGGRPKQGVNYFLRKLLTAQDHRFAKQVVESLVKHACKGNQTAMRELLARVEPAGEESST